MNQSDSDSGKSLNQIYINKYLNDSRSIDKAFGPKLDKNTDTFDLGRHKAEFHQYVIKIGENEYPSTRGLYELIFMKYPTNYTPNDLENYKEIVRNSNVYRVEVDDETSRIKGNGGNKYRRIISKIIEAKQGEGLMLVNNQKPDYIYWDDPNELVDRLRLLIASQHAGHSNHNNEIISIIEELREADIII